MYGRIVFGLGSAYLGNGDYKNDEIALKESIEVKESIGDGYNTPPAMGLAICKKIIKLHDGEIWYESEVEVGTTFHFTVPKA